MKACEKTIRQEKNNYGGATKDCFLADAETGWKIREMEIYILDPIDPKAKMAYMEKI